MRFAASRQCGMAALAFVAFACSIEGAQASTGCSNVNGLSTTVTTGNSWNINVTSQAFTAGEVTTVRSTATGTSWNITAGNTTVITTQPNTGTLTISSSGTFNFQTNSNFNVTGGGTITVSCGTSASGSSSSPSSAQNQASQNIATTVANTNLSLTFQATAYANNVVRSLTPLAKPCARCDSLRNSIARQEVLIQTIKKKLDDAVAFLWVDNLAIPEARQKISELAELIRLAQSEQNAERVTQLSRERDRALDGLKFLESRKAKYDQVLKEGQRELEAATRDLEQFKEDLITAEKEAQSSSLPRSEWRRNEPAMSLMPRRPAERMAERMTEAMPQQAIRTEMFSLDSREPKKPSAAFSFGTEELLQLAQAPDGSNALREALGGKWNAWGEGRITGVNDSLSVSASQGFVGNVGFDYKFRPWLAAGVSLGVETFETRFGTLGGRTGTLGFSAVPYLGVRLDPNLFASAFVGLTSIGYDTSPQSGIAGRFGGTRVFLGGSLTGVWHDGPWRLQPSVSLLYSSENQTAYTDSAGTYVAMQTVQFGRAMAGPEIGYTFTAPDKSWTLEPFFTGRFFLDFATSGQVFYNGLYVATRSNASGSLGGGFSFASKEGFSARFEGSYDSVGVWGLDMWTAMMRLNWNF